MMKTIPRLMHIPLSQSFAVSHSPTKSFKYQPAFIVSVFRNNQNVESRSCARITLPNDSRSQSLLERIFDTLDRAIIKFLDPPLHPSVDPGYTLTDNFAPVDELSPTKCDIVYGCLPRCLDGVYIRNGPNPQFIPNGPQHYLDGDGMVHSVRISHGRVTFCSRYVKTNKYLFENEARSSVVLNIIGGMTALGPFVARAALFCARIVLGQYDIGKGIGVANTSLAFLGGRLYALCESDLPYELRVKENGDVITVGRRDFKGKLSINMTAHPKVDPDTKEAFALRYSLAYPYITYFHLDADGNKQTDVPIFSMKKPSMTHDLAITQKYAIICDIQLGWHPMNLIRSGRLVSIDKAKVPRVGVLPRYAADESEIRWFEVPGLNMFHVVNAWEETDEYGNEVVVLVAPNISSAEHFFDRVDMIQPFMEKVTIHLGTGIVSRRTLSTQNMEFPVINPAYIAKRNKYVYTVIFEKTPKRSRMMRPIGVAKLDVATSQGNNVVANRIYGDNCFGSEPFFIARDPHNSNLKEDDGYLVSYVHNETSGESRFLVMDARSPNLDVVAVIKLPQRVPYGLHGVFIKEKDLSTM